MQDTFIDSFARGLAGLTDPPDPFVGMGGGRLDDWMPSFFQPYRARSWEKQVKSILPGGGEQERPEGEEQPLEITGEFSLDAWQRQVENGRISAAQMAKVPGTGFLMEEHAAVALRAMMNAAKADGVVLGIGNTYRDYETQAAMYRAHLAGEHPAPVAAPGSSNHGWGLAVDFSAISDRAFNWLLRNAGRFGFTNPWINGREDRDSVEPWHWEFGGTRNAVAMVSPTEGGDRQQRGQGGPKRVELEPDEITLVDDLLVDGTPAFGAVLASLLQPVTQPRGQRAERPSPARARTMTGGSVKQQLYRGFMDAGRPDLAKMVRTNDFQTWINAESGWRVDAVSRYFPNHGRNYGLFQFWQGHAWTDNYLSNPTTWNADAYTQARLVARYFSHLTPDDIRRYAAQVRAGDYHGWG